MYDKDWFIRNYNLGGCIIVYNLPERPLNLYECVMYMRGSTVQNLEQYSRNLFQSEVDYIHGLNPNVQSLVHWENRLSYIGQQNVKDFVQASVLSRFGETVLNTFAAHRLPLSRGELGIAVRDFVFLPGTLHDDMITCAVEETIDLFGLVEVV